MKTQATFKMTAHFWTTAIWASFGGAHSCYSSVRIMAPALQDKLGSKDRRDGEDSTGPWLNAQGLAHCGRKY